MLDERDKERGRIEAQKGNVPANDEGRGERERKKRERGSKKTGKDSD